MRNTILSFVLLFSSFSTLFSQSIEDDFSVKKMKKDFEVYKNIRLKANSGLYKYRTKAEMDSIYNWAALEIEQSKTYLDFYNIICQLSDFEGSCHNSIAFPNKKWNHLIEEKEGYFPYPIKLIENKWILNFKTDEIPLGAEIISINGTKMTELEKELYKYCSTDGFNITGKRKSISKNFSRYYRINFGLKSAFEVVYKHPETQEIVYQDLKSISIKDYFKNRVNRYSKSFDDLDYNDPDVLYSFKNIDSETALLTIDSFDIGKDENAPEHKKFVQFLDSTFVEIKNSNTKNLIIDIRNNTGGTDPNELVIYEYLTQRNFSENRSAWISFNKIPYIKYIDTKIPVFLRFLGVIKYNKMFRKEFPLEKEGKYYEDETSYNHIIRTPHKNVFTGSIYLFISPSVASAGSNFGSLAASNKNVTIIGEETQGGYYGHNGHYPISYILPKSKIKMSFSIVNLEQYSIEKENQPFGRGIMPDYQVIQSYEDYLNQTDTQMNFTLDLIKKRK